MNKNPHIPKSSVLQKLQGLDSSVLVVIASTLLASCSQTNSIDTRTPDSFVDLGLRGTIENTIQKIKTTIDSYIDGKSTSIPIGHYEMCNKVPNDPNCWLEYENPWNPISYKKHIATIYAISHSIKNTSIPRTDMEIYGRKEVWNANNREKDCEDYVLTEFDMLRRELHIPWNTLRLAVVRQENGDGHMIGMIDTDDAIIISDNLSNETFVFLKSPNSKILSLATYDPENGTKKLNRQASWLTEAIKILWYDFQKMTSGKKPQWWLKENTT